MSLCIVTMFKNESHIITEWINHYINQGVEHFFMIDNNSNDDYLKHLLPYINNGKVTLILDTRKHSQVNCYNEHFLEPCKKYDWVLVCDLDEFVYARKEYKTIPEYLCQLNSSVSQIAIPWKIFGSNGFNTLDKIQPISVTKTFIKRIDYDKMQNLQGVKFDNNNKYSFNKCIVRTNKLMQFDIHSHITNGGNTTTTTIDPLFHIGYAFSIINENILKHSCLHLNHYPIQSFEWFMRIKATRGDVATEHHENVRNEQYFRGFDDSSNDIYDEELANMVSSELS
jgi:hypothetical protein